MTLNDHFQVLRSNNHVRLVVLDIEDEDDDEIVLVMTPKQTADLCREMIEKAWEIVKEQTEPLLALVKAMGVEE